MSDGEGVRKKDLTPKMIRRAVERATRASMALEGRVVPEGYVRTERVERFLETRRQRQTEESPGPDQAETTPDVGT